MGRHQTDGHQVQGRGLHRKARGPAHDGNGEGREGWVGRRREETGSCWDLEAEDLSLNLDSPT